MAYIPTEWLKDPKNSNRVHEILNTTINTDINLDIREAVTKLEAIGETIIVEKLKDGTITVLG